MPHTSIRPREAYEKIQKEGFAYLDVRTADEFKNGHAKGAINIPIFIQGPAGREFNPNFLQLIKEKFPATAKLVIGCHSGGRSGKACELLLAEGYKNIFNIDGGFGGRMEPQTGEQIAGWEEEGLPTE